MKENIRYDVDKVITSISIEATTRAKARKYKLPVSKICDKAIQAEIAKIEGGT